MMQQGVQMAFRGKEGERKFERKEGQQYHQQTYSEPGAGPLDTAPLCLSETARHGEEQNANLLCPRPVSPVSAVSEPFLPSPQASSLSTDLSLPPTASAHRILRRPVASSLQPVADPISLPDTSQDPSLTTIAIPPTMNPGASSVGTELASTLSESTELWTPLPLRTWVLASFVICYISILVTLEVIHAVEKRRDGISSPSENIKYLWTYGPTAVSLWATAEYRTKQMMPWIILRKGRPTTVENSLLLDYVSPWNVLALFSSIKTRHFPVALAISCSLLLRALLVLSSGLLVLQTMEVERSVSLSFSTVLDPARIPDTLDDATPALMVIGTQRMGLSFPRWTTAEIAVPEIRVTDPAVDADVSGTVTLTTDVFSTDLQCELGEISDARVIDTQYASEISYRLSVRSETCAATTGEGLGPFNFDRNATDDHSEVQPIGMALQMKCGGDDGLATRLVLITGARDALRGQSNGSPTLGPSLPTDWPDVPGSRLMRRQEDGTDAFRGNFTTLVCKPTASIHTQRLTVDTDGTILDTQRVSPSDDHKHLPESFTNTLLNLTFDSISAAVPFIISFNATTAKKQGDVTLDIEPTDIAPSNWTWMPSTSDRIPDVANRVYGNYSNFFLLLNSTSPQPDPAAYMDPDLLTRTARRTFALMAAQIANNHMMVPDAQGSGIATTRGQIKYTGPRLALREVSLRLAEAALALLILLTTSLCFSLPTGKFRADPSTLAGLANVLKDSPEVNAMFKGLGSLSLTSLKGTLAAQNFSVQQHLHQQNHLHRPPMIYMLKNAGSPSTKAAMRTPPFISKPWRPFAFHKYVMLVIIAVPPAVVISLEAIYQHSRSSGGLATVPLDGSVKYAWTWIPAVVMLGIRALFDTMEYATRLLGPYWQLQTGPPAPASKSVALNYLSSPTLVALLRLVRNGNMGVAASVLTMFLAPFLTILASGLYFLNPIPVEEPATVSYLNVLDRTASIHRDGDTHSLILAEMLLNSNLSYPSWTQGEVVLPAIDPETLWVGGVDTSTLTDAELRIRLPLGRGSLNCSDNGRVYARSEELSDPDTTGTFVYAAGFQGCLDERDKVTSFQLLNKRKSLEHGRLHSPISADWANSSSMTHCPLYMGLYGKTSANDSVATGTRPTNLTAGGGDWVYNTTFDRYLPRLRTFACYPYMEEVDSDVTFSLPGLERILSVAVLENTRRRVAGPVTALDFDTLADGTATVDTFMELATSGKSDLFQASDLKWPEMNEAMEHAYRVLWVQDFNIIGRITPTASSLPLLQARVVSPPTYRARLMQDAASTRALEALLLAMLACSVVVFWRHGRCVEILPAEPSSVGVMAALLAGSEFVHMVGGGSGRFDDGELYRYSLGWWDTDPGPGGGNDDDGDDDGDGSSSSSSRRGRSRRESSRRFGVDVGSADPHQYGEPWP